MLISMTRRCVVLALKNMHDPSIAFYDDEAVLVSLNDTAIFKMEIHDLHDKPVRKNALHPANKAGMHLMILLAFY
ncbi:hypothetical protein AYR62_02115 [Secundilactobacillus paracollinoides]|nr:hypothetical protein AYR62_02115 [Secundilactobacillus paracollinoides]